MKSIITYIVLPWSVLIGGVLYNNTGKDSCSTYYDATVSGQIVVVETCKGRLGLPKDNGHIIARF